MSSDTPRAFARLRACASGRMHMPTAATASTTASVDGMRRPRVNPKNASGSATTAAAAISALCSEATMAASAIFMRTAAARSGRRDRRRAAITSARTFATRRRSPWRWALPGSGVLGGEGSVCADRRR
jgi:hypothetical protein